MTFHSNLPSALGHPLSKFKANPPCLKYDPHFKSTSLNHTSSVNTEDQAEICPALSGAPHPLAYTGALSDK